MPILILSDENDAHARHVLSFLRKRGADAHLLDSKRFPGDLRMSLDPASWRGSIVLDGATQVPFDTISAVYWRGYSGVGGPPLPNAEQRYIASNDSRSLFESFLINLPTHWVNGWDGYQLHQTKPVALQRAAAIGVRVPQTLLTNDPQQLREFVVRHQQVIFKPVQGGAHTRRLSAEHLTAEHFDRLSLAPITLQEEIVGTNIRVFVAGTAVHACELKSEYLDFRDDSDPEIRTHTLTAAMQDLCQRIAVALHLRWTGIDFRLTDSGDYVFLEANPSPMFLGFERATGLPLTESLADLLMSN